MFSFKQSIKLGSSSYPQGLTGHKVTASVKTTKMRSNILQVNKFHIYTVNSVCTQYKLFISIDILNNRRF